MKANFKENTILNVSQNHSYDILYGIYLKANFKKKSITMCHKIIATSHYTIQYHSFEYNINIKFCSTQSNKIDTKK